MKSRFTQRSANGKQRDRRVASWTHVFAAWRAVNSEGQGSLNAAAKIAHWDVFFLF